HLRGQADAAQAAHELTASAGRNRRRPARSRNGGMDMRFRRALRPLAWTLVACTLLTAGWAAFMIADPFAGQPQQELQHQLFRQWQHRGAGPGESAGASGHGAGLPRAAADAIASRAANPDHLKLRTGRPFALIRIPKFGHGWQFAIVQGTALSQLALGPGHVP